MIIIKNNGPEVVEIRIPLTTHAHQLLGRFEAARRLDDRGGYLLPSDQADTFARHARAQNWTVADQRNQLKPTDTPEDIRSVLDAIDQHDPEQEAINTRGMTLTRAVRAAYRDTDITGALCECGHHADHHQYRDTDGTVLVALPDETRDVTCQYVGAKPGGECGCTVVRHMVTT